MARGEMQLQPSCNRAATELQQSCTRAAPELHQSCDRAATELRGEMHLRQDAAARRESAKMQQGRREQTHQVSSKRGPDANAVAGGRLDEMLISLNVNFEHKRMKLRLPPVVEWRGWRVVGGAGVADESGGKEHSKNTEDRRPQLQAWISLSPLALSLSLSLSLSCAHTRTLRHALVVQVSLSSLSLTCARPLSLCLSVSLSLSLARAHTR